MFPLWVYQSKEVGIGDFVCLLPTLQSAAVIFQRPIPVFFDHSELAEVFAECSFIERLQQKPPNNPWFSTRVFKNLRRKSTDNNYYCAHYTILGNENISPPQIGTIPPSILGRSNMVALIHGRGPTGQYKFNKDLESTTRQYWIDSIIRKGYTPVLLGDETNRSMFWSKNDLNGCIDLLGKTKLIETLSVLNECKFFMSNDTALYHFSAAMEKKGLVLWRDTHPNMFSNPFDKKRIHHYFNEDVTMYPSVIDDYLLGIS